MSTAVVVLAEGFGQIEAIPQVDVQRQAEEGKKKTLLAPIPIRAISMAEVAYAP